ncbi:MAG: 2-phospho-L-lactate guanylyltransferase [Chloroflexaceae bacterium]|jgi:2-phospho-L-lactate guanylyltransferase|nr:2-phospho-L-lactate guanylyltransferase [Chloroflexaceae bacterium]
MNVKHQYQSLVVIEERVPLANLHVVVPMKRLDQAKSRLAEVLPPATRHALALEMLERVVKAMRDWRMEIAEEQKHNESPIAHRQSPTLWLLSPDPTVLALAPTYAARPLFDPTGDLNGALELARDTLRADGADGMLIIPGDVPLITPGDVDSLVQLLASGADMVLAPDGERNGTNAMGLRLPSALPFQFGLNSFEKHTAAARQLGLHTHVVTSATLALDVDTAESYERYRELSVEH